MLVSVVVMMLALGLAMQRRKQFGISGWRAVEDLLPQHEL
jgi:hypothetical protein